MKIDRTAPKPILLGRHLIGLVYEPAQWFGGILKQCFEAQLDGVFDNEEDGINHLRSSVSSENPNDPQGKPVGFVV